MAYTKNEWEVGGPITLEKMERIENGIANAHSANAATDSTVGQLSTTVSGFDTRIQNNTTNIGYIRDDVSALQQNIEQGQSAWQQVQGAIRMEGDTITYSLADRLSDDEALIGSIGSEVSTARKGKGNLGLKIDDIDSRISQLSGGITSINDKFAEASNSSIYGNYGSVDARIEGAETKIKDIEIELSDAHSSTQYNRTSTNNNAYGSIDARFEDSEQRINQITTELNNAHESTALNKTGLNAYGSIDDRFEAIEEELVGTNAISSRIDTLTSNVETLTSNKVNKTDVENNLLTPDTTDKHVLDARQGRILNETISALDTAYKAADTAITGRLDNIDTAIGADDTANTIKGRIAVLENEISGANGSGTLDDRFDSVEERLDAIDDGSNTMISDINTKIDTIAGELGMTDTNGLKTLGTRVDELEGNIETVATELGMVQSGEIVNTNTRIDTIDSDLNTATTGIKARLTTVEGIANTALQPADISTLTSDVNTLKDKDTIVIDYDGTNSNYTNDLPNIATANIKANADYLIADDEGKYFYWRYINNNWELISAANNGGGGTGSSSGMFISSLAVFEGENAQIPDENIDYFVGNNNSGYTHYRYYIPDGEELGNFVRILPKGLLQDAGVTANGGLTAHTVESNSNVFANFVALKSVTDEVIMENDKPAGTKITFTDTNGTVYPITVVGGGGNASAYTVKLNNEMGTLNVTVPAIEGSEANLQARVVVKEGTEIVESLGNALTITTKYRVNTTDSWTNFDVRTVENNTSFRININSILRTGVKTYVCVVLNTVIDEQPIQRTINYEVTKVEMSIRATNFNPAIVRTGNLKFQYRCIGDGLNKVVHFKIDGVDAVTPVETDSHDEPLEQNIILAGKEPGMHSFQVYFTVNGVSSNVLNYYILYNSNVNNTLPMIALAAERSTITYGDELKINYTTAINSSIEFMENVVLELYTVENNVETVITETHLTQVRNEQVNSWTPTQYPTVGTAYIRGTASYTLDGQTYSDTRIVEITINELVTKYNLTYAGTSNLLYSYNAYGRTNNDADKEVYHYDYTSQSTGNPVLTWTGAFNNFNWATDGYVDGESLTIGGGATHTIDLPVFESKIEVTGDNNEITNISLETDANSYNDPTQNGRTIEIEYEVESATDLNDVIIDCMDENHVGFRVTPQSCYLLNNNVNVSIADDGTGTILNEDAIAAAYLTTGVRTHLVFVIEPWAEEKAYDKKYHQSVNIYINGEFANACPYKRDNSTGNISDSFKTNATMRIGSASCMIKVYSIKMYNRGLTDTEVLQNYKMAPGRTRDKITRFENNDVLSGTKVNYELARKKFNCLLLVGPEPEIRQNAQGQDYNAMPTISPYKGAPSPINRTKDGEVVGKTESGLILTYPDSTNPSGYKTEFSLLDKMGDGGYASSNNVQGTSSQKYPVHNLKVYLMKGTEGKEIYDTSVDILTREVNTTSITTAAIAAYQSVYGSEGELPAYINNCATTISNTVINSLEDMTQAEVVEAIISYLANEDTDVGAAYISTGDELIINHPITGYSKSEKVKYKLPGSKGKGESTLCWKADYMSTDHANTYNANIADSLFTDSLNPDITNEDWQANVQNTVHGIRCLLFKQEGSNLPEFVADGCLNNDKGNSKTYGLEYASDIKDADGNLTADTVAQKWEFTNNSDDLGFFKYDSVFYPTGNDNHYRALDAFESCYPDQGDLEDAQDAYKAEHDNEENPNLNPNYNHLQVLLTWVSQRANYWEETDPTLRAQKKDIFRTEFTRHFNLDHVLVYYLFSEYVALCDNRVKNMFLRSDTIRNERVKLLNGTTIFEGNGNPNADFWKTYTSITTKNINTASIINAINAAYTEIHANDEVGEDEEPPTEAPFAETFANQIATLVQESATVMTEAEVITLIKAQLNNSEEEDAAAIALTYENYSDGNEVVIEHRVRDAAQIDWEVGEEHSNFAIWAPVLYDLDSCFGVENVGLLKIPYNADWQYFSEGQYRFNGHDSIFWLMVEDTFKSEIAAKALTLYNRSRGLNYNTFYQEQVVDNVEETAPAMTNQDMILKFDVPWATGFMNYANKPPTYETPEYKYLQRGTRTAQKTSFIFKRSMLLSSRYQADAFLNDKISFRYGADLSAAQAIIECQANQNLYPAVSFGDNKGWTQALKLVDGTDVVDGLVLAGQKCRIRATSSAKGQDTLFIAGASVLTDIGDLSVFKPYELKVGQGKNLKKLIIGSNAPGYTNAVTTTIENLSACSILEEINIRNCTAFTSLDVSANGLIKRIYAAGSGAGTISLPSGGVLETIEYGANTSNITIINHGTLQNFIFEVEEGEENPTYSNLNKLWIENTPNVPIIDIVTKKMGSLTNGVRLVNINLNLGNDPLFLEVITSDVAARKRLDSTGSLDNTQYPYISGTITINSIRASLLAKVNSIYGEDLVIVSNNIVQEYEIKYENYDGTLLYTDYGTNEDYLKDPAYDINPITNKVYLYNQFPETNGLPTKPEDAQYKYKFGTYDNNNKYRKFSGWVRKGTTTNPTSGTKINGSIVLVAVYPTTEDQYYKIFWYDEFNGTKIREDDAKYGDDLSSALTPVDTGELARIKYSGNLIKAFSGWSRPLGKITSNINVYGQWQSSSINESTPGITMSTLTAADLYAISRINDSSIRRTLLQDHLGETITIPMGNDFNYIEGVNMVNLLGNNDKIILDGTDGVDSYIQVYNDITPLRLNSDWTIALDYKFLFNSGKANFVGKEYVLASCYQNANSSIVGFKVSLIRDTSGQNKHPVQVSWGNQTITIDYVHTDNDADNKTFFYSYRNVVVLSHNTDAPNALRVTYVAPNLTNNNANGEHNYGSNYGTHPTNTTLTWDSNVNITAPLIIGGNYNGTTTNIETNNNTRKPAEGIIYWAKYWDTDLGENGCSQLASWPHENVAFYLSGYNGSSDDKDTEQIYEGTSLSFVAAQGMGDRYVFAVRTGNVWDDDGYFGWHLTDMRSICNNLIYQGVPEVYKSVINLTNTTTMIRHTENGAYAAAEVEDYMFLPSIREVDITGTSENNYITEVNTAWMPPWTWMVPSRRTNVLGFVSGSEQNVETQTPSYSSFLYRFLGREVASTARIFNTGTKDPSTISNLRYRDKKTGALTNISVQSGDVWINESGEAYMYFTNEEITEGIRINISTTNGGWKKADIWNLRSIGSGGSYTAENSLMRIDTTGTISQGPSATQLYTNGRLLCPEFTI